MTKKAKEILEKNLKENANKKYYDNIVDVKVLDKHNCEITIENDYADEHTHVTLPIETLYKKV